MTPEKFARIIDAVRAIDRRLYNGDERPLVVGEIWPHDVTPGEEHLFAMRVSLDGDGVRWTIVKYARPPFDRFERRAFAAQIDAEIRARMGRRVRHVDGWTDDEILAGSMWRTQEELDAEVVRVERDAVDISPSVDDANLCTPAIFRDLDR